jgi:uncharacterized protein involved in exopolysaccharide biosynthesis
MADRRQARRNGESSVQGPQRSIPPVSGLPQPEAASGDAGAASPVELIFFALRAARRHAALCVGVCSVVAVLGVVVVSAIPSLYEATTKVYLSQNNALTAALANGRRQDDGQTALRGLQEAVMSQDNLLSLVREAKLAETWPQTRTWALRWKDAAVGKLFGPPSSVDLERALVAMLKTSIFVTVEDGTSVRFTVAWRTRNEALVLTQLSSRNFFAGRTQDQSSAITRAIGLLEEQLKQVDAAVDPAIREMQRTVETSRAQAADNASKVGARSPVRDGLALKPRTASPPANPGRPEVTTEMLQDIRRAQRDVSEPWQRRLAELKFQLTELRTIFGPAHPLVTQQEAKVQAASETPPELARLKEEESSLMERLASAGGNAADAPAPSYRRTPSSGPSAVALERNEDPEVAAARIRVELLLAKSRDLSGRLDGARMEKATAQAGEKYRYSVVEAPELPGKAIKPKRPALLAAVIGAALVLGFLAGAVRELLTGRLLEAWQVRRLGIAVLGEVELDETPVRPRS